jgi:DNA-binding CsgD family transcriptional regulator
LADGYRAGATVYDLAAKFGINRKTVSIQLKALGVPMRRTSLTDAELTRAVALYGSGLSLAAIGVQLGRHHSVVERALKRTGVHRCDSDRREAAEP